MTENTQVFNGTAKLYFFTSAIACFGLGTIAVYSSGLGLIDPTFHRAAGFALALIVAISTSRIRREANSPATGIRATLHLVQILPFWLRVFGQSCRLISSKRR